MITRVPAHHCTVDRKISLEDILRGNYSPIHAGRPLSAIGMSRRRVFQRRVVPFFGVCHIGHVLRWIRAQAEVVSGLICDNS